MNTLANLWQEQMSRTALVLIDMNTLANLWQEEMSRTALVSIDVNRIRSKTYVKNRFTDPTFPEGQSRKAILYVFHCLIIMRTLLLGCIATCNKRFLLPN
ncbi:hypothetical protein AVEN_232913-1 [Araneus ventricosus]|uniref:Uncharacterized protein n=1 Tax=Araneus ventricosus TaxID=182803 RepID=A0A4Y2EGZ1_ARAVE|nr:hypothetical protein AVEN_232913-1 [Araneus ventricosus]